MKPIGSILVEKYELLAILGSGGTSIVYLARDIHLKSSLWAIKELNKQGNILDFNRQYHEAELLAELNHPGMPRVVQFFDDEQASYIVMDYIGGESLAEIMKEGLIDEARIKE